MKLPRFESLYCGFTFALPWVVKIGRSDLAEQRWRGIKAGLETELGYKVRVYVFHLPVLYAQQCENLICYLYGSWKFKGLKTCTGRTEFYWFPNFILFSLVGLFLWHKGAVSPHWKAFAFLVLPIPIDACIVVLLIAITQYCIIGSIFYFLLNFLGLF